TQSAELFASGMLFPMLVKTLPLALVKTCIWECSRCHEWKADKCQTMGNQPCPFTRSGQMDIARGRFILKSGGRFVARDVWRCNNPACVGHDYYFFAEKCRSY